MFGKKQERERERERLSDCVGTNIIIPQVCVKQSHTEYIELYCMSALLKGNAPFVLKRFII